MTKVHEIRHKMGEIVDKNLSDVPTLTAVEIASISLLKY